MYYAGFDAVAIVWIGLAAVVLMGAYWDRSSIKVTNRRSRIPTSGQHPIFLNETKR
jgi:hypothetical protein